MAASLRLLEQQGYSLFNTPTKRFIKGSAFGNNPSSKPPCSHFCHPDRLTRHQLNFARAAGLYGIYDFNITGRISEPLGHLDERDAWIWLGCTPPQLEYYSQRSYVFNTPGDGSVLFASLGDSNNQLTFNTTAGGPCNRTAAIITASDRTTAVDIADALVAAGLPREAINYDVIAPALVRMGHTLDASTFLVLFRVALFADAEAGDAYTSSEWPAYHVTHATRGTSDPFPVVSIICACRIICILNPLMPPSDRAAPPRLVQA